MTDISNSSLWRVNRETSAVRKESRCPRVAWLAGSNTVERIGSVVHPLAVGLIDELIELTLVCPQGGMTGRLPIPPVEVIFYRRPEWWASRPRVAESLAGRLGEAEIELLHALDGSVANFGYKLARLAGVELLVSSYLLADADRLIAIGSPAPVVLAASEAIIKRMRAKRISHDRLHLVRPGMYHVSHPTCFLDPHRSAAIVACGDLDHFSSIETILKAFAVLRNRSYDVVFFLIGSGRAEKQARTAARRLGLQDELTFVDHMPAWQMPGIFKAADICIVPRAARGVDLMCLMAMAAGVPLLTARETAPDFAKDGQTAVCYAGGDESDLIPRLVEMLDNHEAAQAIAEGAIEYIRANHSPAQMVATTAQLYRSLT